jgi:hypothetical protein
MLVSTIPSLPLELLELCLERVRRVLLGYSEDMAHAREEEGEGKDKEMRQVLVQTLLEMLLSEQMDGEAKVVGLKWWYENLDLVRAVFEGGEGGEGDVEEQGKMLQSRL